MYLPAPGLATTAATVDGPRLLLVIVCVISSRLPTNVVTTFWGVVNSICLCVEVWICGSLHHCLCFPLFPMNDIAFRSVVYNTD